jgi:ribonuclease-3
VRRDPHRIVTMNEREEALRDLQARLGYQFSDVSTLLAALTHSSATDGAQPRRSERLEFLGDAVLGLVLADLLMQQYPDANEGKLSKFRAALVSTASFAAKARELRLNRELALGKGEEKTGGREKPSILAALYEAVVGAVFLDCGYEQARQVVQRHFSAALGQIGSQATTDPKTELQEVCQRMQRATPAYRLVAEVGPDHARHFVVEVTFREQVLARGEGPSKRSAEQDAARQALAILSRA